MKKTLFTTLLLGLMGYAYAQTQLPNVGYETWTNVSGSNAEPSNWNSNKTGGGFANLGPQTCFPETASPYSGTYSVRLETKSYLGTPVNGTVTTGKIQAPSTNPLAGYVETLRSDANHNAPFTGRPDSLVGYYKYTSASSDYAKIEAILHGNYDVRSPVNAGSTPFVIGTATFFTPTASVSGWTRFSVPFTYVNGSIPNYALVIGTSSAVQGGAVVGSIFWLDEVQVVYRPTISVGSITAASPYYISNTQGANVSIAYTVAGTYTAGNTFTAQLSNASGSFASPVNIGSVAATSGGTINATIPAGTATGAGYRIRIISSNPSITSADNGSDLTIYLCTNPVNPSIAQTIVTNSNGTSLNVAESIVANSREWKFATISGGPYSSFGVAQTLNIYTPNFTTSGTYHVVCQSNFPTGLQVRSNEIQVNVIGNEITPSTSQSILVAVNGTLLTVTETPAGTAREWKFATASGGPYNSFGSTQTSSTYTPNFSAAGTYYVVCQSTISSLLATSNEVVVSVGTVTLSTGTVSGAPFEFSPSAPAAAVSVPYTASAAFTAGNVFTAQLSDATGSFASPANIGSLIATGSGSVSASIPSATAAGTGYRIRVVGSNPAIAGSDNGIDLVVDQFNNSIAPSNTQTILVNNSGTAIMVTESQNATHLWKYATVQGGPYTNIVPTATGVSYTALFNTLGTYYVVCESTNQYSDAVTSGAVTVVVTNGTALSTTSATNSPFLTSPSANIGSLVTFSSNAVFSNGNVFTAEISDATGGFGNPIAAGTLSGTTISSFVATIPNNLATGNSYRIRVVSSNPAIIGTDNGVNLSITQFENSVAPIDTQYIQDAVNGNMLTVTATHNTTQEWYHRPNIFAPFVVFSPAETGATYTPNFTGTTFQYVHCRSVNTWADTVTSNDVIIIISPTSTENFAKAEIRSYWSGNDIVVDLSRSDLSSNATVELLDMNGRLVLMHNIPNKELYSFTTTLSAAVYVLRISDENRQFTVQTAKPE